MQHANYPTTDKFYVDGVEVAKQMAKNGFRNFDKKNEKGTPVRHSSHKKRPYTSVKSCFSMWVVLESNQ